MIQNVDAANSLSTSETLMLVHLVVKLSSKRLSSKMPILANLAKNWLFGEVLGSNRFWGGILLNNSLNYGPPTYNPRVNKLQKRNHSTFTHTIQLFSNGQHHQHQQQRQQKQQWLRRQQQFLRITTPFGGLGGGDSAAKNQPVNMPGFGDACNPTPEMCLSG